MRRSAPSPGRLPGSEFLGYATEQGRGGRLCRAQGRQRSGAGGGGRGGGVRLQPDPPSTPSRGGQEGDAGVGEGAEGLRLEITDVQERGGLRLHAARVISGVLAPGAEAAPCRGRGAPGPLAPPSLGDPPLARGPAPRSRPPCDAEGLACRRRPPALRFLPTLSPSPARNSVPWRPRSIATSSPTARWRPASCPPRKRCARAGALGLFGEKYGEEVRVVSMGCGGCKEALGRFLHRALRRDACGAHR